MNARDLEILNRRTRDLSPDRLRELLHYDPLTGVFTWLAPTSRRVHIGRVAGRLKERGYREINLDGFSYASHRLAWLYVHGSWPAEEIDHINGNPGDNRICNLRECSRAENAQTLNLARVADENYGTTFHKARGKWQAQIKVAGKYHFLGLFDFRAEAHAAYLEAKRQMHPMWVGALEATQ